MTVDVDLSIDVQKIMASDLMSDVLSFCGSGALLITGLTNSQVIRTAHVAELCGVVFTMGKRPSENTIRLAQDKNIPLWVTDFSMYEACGILYSNEILEINKNVNKSDD